MTRSSMIRTAAAAIALVVTAGTMAVAQPKLEIVGGDTYDWGKVAPAKLTTVVQVKNAGNADLKITEVRPGCGCTAAPIDKDLLKPGEIGKISITLDVTSRSGLTEKIVTITSNDTAAPSQVLHLKADVRRAVTFTPMQYLVVANGAKGVEAAASPITIKNTSDAPITVEVPQLAAGEKVKVRFDMKGKKELKPGEEFTLLSYITPTEAMSVQSKVMMKTSSSEMPSIEIPLSVTVSETPVAPQTPVVPQLSNAGQK